MTTTALKSATKVLFVLCLAFTIKAQAQQKINVVTTAVPFLRISPDARSGGMGDLGVATSPDASSSFWNMGKVAFNESQGGLVATYTPWLKDLVNDVYLASVSGYYKMDENQAFTGSLRYFSLGNIQFTDASGNSLQSFRPREFGFDLGYSRKLSDKMGLGIALRYINSDLAGGATVGSTTYKAGSTVAADLGFYYDGKNESGDGWAFGATMTNLGGKIDYTDNATQKDFIPANLGLGTTYTKKYNSSNSLTFGVDFNKLLVPALPTDANGNVTDPNALADYRSKGVISSWFSSFSDFPGQANVSLGAEYWYNNQFALRAGYFYEDKSRGDRRYFTVGVGLKYNVFGLNFSYLAPSGSGVNRNPLSNTLRFSVLFDFDGNAASTSDN